MSQAAFDLDLLARRSLPSRRFDAGERIFLEDDAGDCMYVVRSGRVDVITFGHVLETIGPGGAFGEMALIDAGARSAAALAAEATEVAVIDRTAFEALLRDEPGFALAIMRLLAGRIRRIDAALRGF
jgi:CRP/FNR family transcriptional regulator, cyclic AMP receptor protein